MANLKITQLPAASTPTDTDLMALVQNVSTTPITTKVALSDLKGALTPPGIISPYAGSSSPSGWLLCNGATVSQTTYAALFAVTGHTYGPDPGGGNFILPNLKGNVPVGYDSTQTEFNALGKTGGEKTHTLSVAELAVHQHDTQFLASGSGGGGPSHPVAGPSIPGVYEQTGTTGSGTPHNNIQPYLTINYIIKT